MLVTIDVAANTTRARSVYECSNVVDVALFTDPEEIYLVKSSLWMRDVKYRVGIHKTS